jgi:hypothetical protein
MDDGAAISATFCAAKASCFDIIRTMPSSTKHDIAAAIIVERCFISPPL